MKIVITSHGELCEGILTSYQMIAGDTHAFTSIKLDENGISDFSSRLNKALDTLTQNDQVLVLSDLAGGTPYNETLRYALAHPNRVYLIAGLNLPMLIEVGMAIENDIDIQSLLELAVQAGQSAISAASTSTNNDEDLDF